MPPPIVNGNSPFTSDLWNGNSKRLSTFSASSCFNNDALSDVETRNELFKAFADLPRAKIICALSQSELCVSDLAQLLEMNQSAVSHQLRLLKQARLVKTRRDGKVRYYSLADEHIQEMFKVAFEHIMEE